MILLKRLKNSQNLALFCKFRYLNHRNWPQTHFEQLVWVLVEKMAPCFQSLEHVYGHQSNFRKMCVIACQKLLKSPFLVIFRYCLCHLDPIFMPFSKWGFSFLYLKNWRSYEAKCKFQPILYRFCKNGSGDHMHAPNFENRVPFFPQGPKLNAQNVFGANYYG